MKKKYWQILLAAYLFVILCEILAKTNSLWGFMGMVAWYLLLLLLGVFTLYCWFYLINFCIEHKLWVLLLALGTFFWLLFFNVANFLNLSGETTQETTCILNILQTPGAGFTNTCFLGYPARQFYLSALPSLLAGRSLISLNLGGVLYFLIGFVVFLSGICKKFADKPETAQLLAIISLALPLHFYYFNYLLGNFEQSFYPVSLGFLLAGLYLHFLHKPKNYLLILIGFTLLLLIFSYTTALGLVALAMLVLIYEFRRSKSGQKNFLLLIFCVSLVELYFSWQYRQDVRLLTGGSSITELKQDLILGMQILITLSGGREFFSNLLHPLFILSFLAFSIGAFGKKGIIIALWMVLIFAAAIVSQGYGKPPVDYALHRAIIIIPVFLTGIVLNFNTGNRHLLKIFKSSPVKIREFIYFSICILLLFFLATGIIFNFQYLQSKTESKYYDFSLMINWLQGNLPKQNAAESRQIVYVSNRGDGKFENLHDFTQYFFPDYIFNYRKDLCKDTLNKSMPDTYFMVTDNSKQSPCFKELIPLMQLLGSYSGTDKLNWQLYRLK